MKTKKRTSRLVIALSALILLTFMIVLPSCRKDRSGELVLFDFETDADLDQLYWNCHTLYTLSDSHVTHGTRSLKLDLFPSDYPGFISSMTVKDWSNFQELSFDVYNSSQHPVQIGVRIDDRKNYPDYGERYNNGFVLRFGRNNISIPLNTLVTSGSKRKLDLANIRRLFIFMARPVKKSTLYLDNIKLLSTQKTSVQ